jgi:guanylate kinase
LKEAVDEIRDYSQYDYVLLNEDVEASVENLVAIVNANRSRRKWMEEKIRHILETFENGRNESETHIA